ncbi:mediator of RNA polymerase II transcription subunit 13 [Acrasis kona]|uniref:Mediator of RNA polymerase II transcription subunit 13 n=1 Tax=Acrasis kona TaxID=1008807 RepID=A0AAW2Z527_9EUKA
MDLWHYPQKVNENTGVMELWDFPNGQPLYQTSLEQEVDLISKDIYSITQELSDVYQTNDVQRALIHLATSTNPDTALAYNIIKQLIETHFDKDFLYKDASGAGEEEEEEQEEVVQHKVTNLYNGNQIEVVDELECSSDEEDEYNSEEVITTNMPFYSSPSQPEVIIPAAAPLLSRHFQPQALTNSQDPEFASEKSSPCSLDSEQYMDRFDEYMLQDDFSCKPRVHSRNNSGAEKYNNPSSKRKATRRRFYEEAGNQTKQCKPQPTHIKKLARVKNNPNARRFRNKKSYLTRREQWALVPVGSPTNHSSNSNGERTPKGSISLDSSSVGCLRRSKPEVDMNRNVPTFMFGGPIQSKQ